MHKSKIDLIKMILAIENEDLIDRFQAFLQEETKDFWEELSLNEKEEIKLGMSHLDKGDSLDFDEFLKKVS